MGLTRKVLAVFAVTCLAQSACVFAQSLVSTYINVTSIPSKPMFDAMRACIHSSTWKRLKGPFTRCNAGLHASIWTFVYATHAQPPPRHYRKTHASRDVSFDSGIVALETDLNMSAYASTVAELQRSISQTNLLCYAGYAGGDNILYDNYNAEMITKRSAQMYCQTGAPSFPVVEATIAGAHAVRTHVHTVLGHAHSYMCSNSFVLTAGYDGGRAYLLSACQ